MIEGSFLMGIIILCTPFLKSRYSERCKCIELFIIMPNQYNLIGSWVNISRIYMIIIRIVVAYLNYMSKTAGNDVCECLIHVLFISYLCGKHLN